MKKRKIDELIISSMRLRQSNVDEVRPFDACRAIERMAAEYLRGLITFSYEVTEHNTLATVSLNRLAYFLKALVKLANGCYIPDLKATADGESFKLIITNCAAIDDESFYKLYGYAFESGFEILLQEDGAMLLSTKVRRLEVLSIYDNYGNVQVERIFNALANILLEFNFYNGVNVDKKFFNY